MRERKQPKLEDSACRVQLDAHALTWGRVLICPDAILKVVGP